MNASQISGRCSVRAETGTLPRLRNWVVPGTDVVLPLRDGCAGFVLIHFVLWWHEKDQRID